MRHPDDGLLEEQLDGELAEDAARDLEAHLAACPACRERLEAARALRAEADDLVAALGEPAPRPAADDLPDSLRRAPRRGMPWRAVAWAASVVLAVGVGYAGGTMGRRQGEATAPRVGTPTEPPSVAATEPPAAGSDREPRAGAVARPQADAAEVRRPDLAAEPGADAANRFAKAAPVGPPASPSVAQKAAEREEQAGFALESRPAVSLDPAIRALGGSIRLLDGLSATRVEVTWLRMPSGDSAAVVELTYADPAGHPIVLRQSRTTPLAEALGAADALGRRRDAAQAIAPAAEAPNRRAAELPDGEVSWVDAAGFRLVLRADADADSLAKLRARVR